jgi:ABC-type sugar transport system ATPase subunit
MTDRFVLEIDHLTVAYPAMAALSDVSLGVRPGELLVLLGQRGAGKTTLAKVLGGFRLEHPHTGTILLNGEPVEFRSPRDAIRAGIRVLLRSSAVFPNLSVAENIALGEWPSDGRLFINRRQAAMRAEETLRKLDINLDLDMKAGGLSAVQKQLLTLARVLSGQPLIIVLDEPTTAATCSGEMDRLFNTLRRMTQRGVSILYLTSIAEVLRLADRATVLRDGVVVGEFEPPGLAEGVLAGLMASQYPDRAHYVDDDEQEERGDLLGGLMSYFKRRR